MASTNEELFAQEGLDVNAALEFVGDLDLYREILYDYYMAIDEKSKKIRGYIESDNIKEYTVEVHAIKSSSRMIGAMELGNEAERLEHCGHHGDWDTIKADTEKLLEHMQSYKPIIEPHMVESEDF